MALLAIFAIGVVLRLRGWVTAPSSLWFDEALWAQYLMERPIFSHNIRPFGFMRAARLFVGWFGATEFWLRFIPKVASIRVSKTTIRRELRRHSGSRASARFDEYARPRLAGVIAEPMAGS